MSNRRRVLAGRGALAQLDGEQHHVRACCSLRLTIGVRSLKIEHDDGCPALDPRHPQFLPCRIQANRAAAALVEARTGCRSLTLLIPNDGDAA